MCSPSSRAAQRKYNASEHGKQVRKAYREKKAENSENKTITLPALSGSEKQVAWANDIRQNVVNEYMEFINSDELTLKYSDAQEIFSSLYSRGLFDKEVDHPATTKFAEMQRKAKQENPGAKITIIDEIADNMYVGKVVSKADEAYRKYMAQYKATKATGNPDKSLVQKAKVERAKVYKKEIKELLQRSVNNVTSASAWINNYKSYSNPKK